MPSKTDSKQRRVLLVDDHPIVRHGLGLLIEQEADLTICGETDCAAQALDCIDEVSPNIVLVDISLRGSNGLELTKSLKETHPKIPVLVLSMHDENLYAERALRSGARGYVMKQESAGTVLDAIRTILDGGVYLSDSLSSVMLREFVDGGKGSGETFGVASLSNRELEVFELIGRGHSTRKIADRLQLSIKTIETHRAHVKQKLKLDNGTELVHRAFHWIETGNSKN